MRKRLSKDKKKELNMFMMKLQRGFVIDAGFRNLHLRGDCSIFKKSDIFPEYHNMFDMLLLHDYIRPFYIEHKGEKELGWYSPVKRIYDEEFWPYINGIEELIFHKQMRYKAYLQTDHWIDFSRKAKENADDKCQECGAENTILSVHHKYYKCRGEEKFSDVQVLCRSCHAKKHVGIISKKKC